MSRYRASIHSSARPRSAFAYLSRFDRAAEWDPGVEAGEMLTPEPVRVGYAVPARRPIPRAARTPRIRDRRVPGTGADRVAGREPARSAPSTRSRFDDDPTGTVVVYDAAARRQGHRAAGRPVARARLSPHRRSRRRRPAHASRDGADAVTRVDRCAPAGRRRARSDGRRELQPHRIRGTPCAVRLGCRARCRHERPGRARHGRDRRSRSRAATALARGTPTSGSSAATRSAPRPPASDRGRAPDASVTTVASPTSRVLDDVRSLADTRAASRRRGSTCWCTTPARWRTICGTPPTASRSPRRCTSSHRSC